MACSLPYFDLLVDDFWNFIVKEARRWRLFQRLGVELDALHSDVAAREDLLNELRRPINRYDLGDIRDPALDAEIRFVAAVEVHAV